MWKPTLLLLLLLLPVASPAAPSVAPALQGTFDLTDISGSFRASMAQMAFDPAGRLYVTTFHSGVQRFDYDPNTALPAPVPVSAIRSLGIAFHDSAVHGLCMYLTPFLGSRDDPATIVRLTDDDGDGNWGEVGETNVAIVNNIPVGSHRLDQLQVRGNTLFVGIGTRTDPGDDESAYNGTISWIKDLDAVPSIANAAGFGGADFMVDPIPYTSTATDKLTIHSSGTRNPFGLAIDGIGRLWMSNNQGDVAPTPQDEFFLATSKGDYGYPSSNPSTNWRTHPTVVSAGYFTNVVPSLTVATPDPTYEPDDPTPGAAPGGLGPNSSADGFDFYDGNAFPLQFHHDAFVARASSSSTGFTGLPETYQDFVAVDLETGEVLQIADDFTRPLDVLADSLGNLLFAEFDAGGQGIGRIYRLTATTPHGGTHSFQWDSLVDGNWSDRLAWDVALVPNAWDQERYAVTIDAPAVAPLVTVDMPVRVESLTVGDALGLDSPLRVDGDLTLGPAARLRVAIGGPVPGVGFPTIQVGNVASLGGVLEIVLVDGYEPAANTTFDLILTGQLQGSFASVVSAGQWEVQDLGTVLRLRVVHATGTPPSHPGFGLRVAPNPFNPRTSVLLELPAAAWVEVRVHDAAGRALRHLSLGSRAAGSHRIDWDGRDDQGRRLASGVYFVQAKVGEVARTVQISLVK